MPIQKTFPSDRSPLHQRERYVHLCLGNSTQYNQKLLYVATEAVVYYPEPKLQVATLKHHCISDGLEALWYIVYLYWIQCNVLVTFSEGGLRYQSFLLCHPCSTITQHSFGMQAEQSLPDFGGLLKLLVLEGVFWTDQAQRAYQAWILGEHHRPRRPDMEANQIIS